MRAPNDRGLFQLELYALCRDGRVEEAEALSRAVLGRRAHTRGWRPFAAWLGERFGFAVGS